MNNQNLRPFNQMSLEERRAISIKGGKASGAARRRRRQMIEANKAELRAEEELRDGAIAELRDFARCIKYAAKHL